MSLLILITLQLFFCLIFFLYFKKKIDEHLKLKDFKNEINEVITHFNRSAEKHISQLEEKINFFQKLQDKNNHQLPTPPPQTSINDNIEKIQKIDLKKEKLNSQTILPVQAVKSFYAQFSDSQLAATKTSKASNTHTQNEINSSDERSPQKNIENTKQAKPSYSLAQKIQFLKAKGFSDLSIAEKLSISTAEVKFISKLKKI